MLFGIKLQNELYPPWKDQYMNYEKLKKLLKETSIEQDWSDADEASFVEFLDSELEKVYTFQTKQYHQIEKDIESLENLITIDIDLNDLNQNGNSNGLDFLKDFDFKSFQKKLEDALENAQELDHFARLNFTGFAKIVKKHDRLHPNSTVKPLLNVRLRALPFYSEDYSPLLYRISILYNFLRENIEANGFDETSVKRFKSFKFWIHPDNLMEVKTRILRHLPVLVYDNQNSSYNSSDFLSNNNDVLQNDPTITSLYFDNSNFLLYNSKLQKKKKTPTLRLRWSGKLIEKPDIFIEKRIFDFNNSNEVVDPKDEVVKIQLKEKYINKFITNQYSMKKNIQKMKNRGTNINQIKEYQNNVKILQDFITENELQPILRCVYTRTAFQIPGDDRVRIIIDSDIMSIREDCFDRYRPIRDPNNWHRTDIDSKIDEPYSLLRKGEFSKFPYSVMEIIVQGSVPSSNSTALASSANTSSNNISNSISNFKFPLGRKHGRWIEELTSSHLVEEIPNFSKFIQGIASLYTEDDKLDMLPFWLSELENDIRKNPKDAYDEQILRLKRRREDEVMLKKMQMISPSLQPREAFKVNANKTGTNLLSQIIQEEESDDYEDADIEDHESSDDEDNDNDEVDRSNDASGSGSSSASLRKKNFRSKFPDILSGGRKKLSKLTNVESEDEEFILPAGVKKPDKLIKNANPVKVEAKVWLANERTFNRWLHVSIVLSTLTFIIYSSVKKAKYEDLANKLAFIYFFLTVFSCIWGYAIYIKRLNIIQQRDGKHLDAPFGPLVIGMGLLTALVINFVVGLKKASEQMNGLGLEYLENMNPLHRDYQYFFFKLVGGNTANYDSL
ncbi:SPX-domain-containing protein [Ascoidea rubescens DSM 1968]|uniref:SPX-domain-containing protein n=1 Tax=Ascoidea rubescens DSM 1968 TaxID=1344418 RepID=A0A1D2VB65_9ASCO|nr:SPX-domain-containing protein [Ascoidea rubescens DSM 1968]ODV58687.1 SPX-domain-containing protein [Ascoidea rubescens DSM 1968]